MQQSAKGSSHQGMRYTPPQGQRQEQVARTELLEGAQLNLEQVVERPVDEMNNSQIMQQAVDTHKETTAAAKRALKIVEQTKEIQVSTQAALKDQGDQMQRIEVDMEKIGEDLSYSERILRFMKLCCCVGFFCSCCTEPNRNAKDKDWRGSGSVTQQRSYSASNVQMSAKQQRQQFKGQKQQLQPQQPAQYPGVSTNGLAEIGFQQQAGVIQQETAKQDQYLDEISKGLDQLKFGAQRMNEELHLQQAHADRIRTDADALGSKLYSVNREGFKRI
eukprot:GHRR01004604.1.p1 GENE.GHRR01004604.1~~GHRR01004604.1.p1  ORF type:complete len:275 (+),score=73.15 GHRR01004604.1:221-1045(+)